MEPCGTPQVIPLHMLFKKILKRKTELFPAFLHSSLTNAFKPEFLPLLVRKAQKTAKTVADRSLLYQIFRKYLRGLCSTKYHLF